MTCNTREENAAELAQESALQRDIRVAHNTSRRHFDDALDEATHAAFAPFEYLGLPDEGSDQRTAILHRINEALAEIMAEWL